ncbi:MAG TPA: hypothetical protein VGK74_10960 [Symbiobacteriaceae bacterium]
MVKLVGGLLLGGMALLPVLSGCGGKTATTAAAPTAAPAAAPTATPAPAAAAPAPANAQLDSAKVLFQETAGGQGCQQCHGKDAKGTVEVGAPDIRGKQEADIRKALENVEMMRIVKLSDEEITAVAAYLQVLNK